MTSIQKALLQVRWQPCYQSVRFRKLNIQKPRHPHFTRDIVQQLCKPILPLPMKKDLTLPWHLKCGHVTSMDEGKVEIDNPYERLLAKEMTKWMEESKLVAIFHRNIIKGERMFEIRLALKKNNMKLKTHAGSVMKQAIKGTKFEAADCLFNSHSCVICCPEADVTKLIKLLKKMPEMVLLACFVEDRFMSRPELESYSKLPDLQTARAQLVGILNLASQSLVRNLTYHQNNLVQQLNQHIELSQKTDSATGSHDQPKNSVTEEESGK